jgi:hypothetical protein
MRWMMNAGYSLGAAHIAAASAKTIVEILEHEIDAALQALSVHPVRQTGEFRNRLPGIRALARQAAYSGQSIEPWARDIGDLNTRFVQKDLPSLGPRLGHAFLAGLHFGSGYMRCHQGFQVDLPVVNTNVEEGIKSLEAIHASGLPLNFAEQARHLREAYAGAHSSSRGWSTVADFFDAIKGDVVTELPGP